MRDGSASYDEAAATDGWTRLLDFLAAHLGASPGPGEAVRWRPGVPPTCSWSASKPKGPAGSSAFPGRRRST